MTNIYVQYAGRELWNDDVNLSKVKVQSYWVFAGVHAEVQIFCILMKLSIPEKLKG